MHTLHVTVPSKMKNHLYFKLILKTCTIEIILLNCELSLINAWCCRADAIKLMVIRIDTPEAMRLISKTLVVISTYVSKGVSYSAR